MTILPPMFYLVLKKFFLLPNELMAKVNADESTGCINNIFY